MFAHSTSKRLALVLGGLLAAPALAMGLGAGHSLVPRASFTDPQGLTHTRLVHRYQGLRVWGEELVDHGRGPLTASPGLPMLDAFTPAAEPLDLDLTPSVPLAAAQRAILPAFGAAAATVAFSGGERVIVPRVLDLPSGVRGRAGLDATRVHQVPAGYALAYLIRARAATGNPLTDVWDFLVDAHTGQVLGRIAVNQGLAQAQGGAAVQVAPAPAAGPAPLANAPAKGVGRSLYSGTVRLDTSAGASGFLLLDTTRGQGGVFGGNAVTDMAHTLYGPPQEGSVCANPSNTWGDGSRPVRLGPTTTPAGLTVAVDAAYGLQAAWDYFRQVHQRDGIDGLGTSTFVRVNYGGNANETDNAYWSSSNFDMTVMDGRAYWPFNTVTVLGHELTHGVTAATAGLVYYRIEAGGLNEATSDIFGVMADTYARLGSGGTLPAAGANWYIPRYLANPPGQLAPMRYLDKPSRDGRSPDAWRPGIGGMDMHLSSGPMNRAFYFLSQGASADPASDSYSSYLPGGMAGIGNDAAARIWYRALTAYLTPTSDYKQARTAALRAALDLFPPDAAGNPSPQTLAVRRAFGAINVGDPDATTDDFTIPGITASVAPSGTVTPSGANLTLSAVTSSPARVNEVDYFVDQVLVAAAFNPPSFTVPEFDPAHVLANGAHVLTAAAFAPSGNQGTSLGVPFTVDNPVQQLLRDPGLEGGGLGWQGDSGLVVQTDYAGGTAHGGYRYARFDRSAGRQSLTLSQQVSLPAGTSALLGLWTQVQGNPALGAADTLQILLQPQGQAPVLLDTLDNRQNRADWLRRSYDLSAYLGQTVTLSLVSSIQPGSGTAFLADDFCLACSGAGQAQVQVSLDPAAFSAAPLTVDAFPGGGPVGPLYARVTGSPGSAAVTWSVLEGAQGGSLGPGPVYTPPARPGFYHVVATSVADPGASAQVSVQVLPAASILPAAATLEAGAALPFTVLTAPAATATLSASAGSLQPSGPGQWLFTAPASPGPCTLTALSSDGGSATATVTVIALVQVTVVPAALTMVPGSSYPLAATVSGSANTDVSWTIQEGPAGGTIADGGTDAPPVYTAPAAAGTYHLVATSAADPARSAVLTVTVLAGGIAINPASPVVLAGGTIALQAFAEGGQPVSWSLPAGPSAGAIDGYGVYTAPAAPGSYLAVASAGSLSASVTIRVVGTNFSGDGKPFMNSADLAILADAWGATPGAANWNPVCDLNQDGTVDDQDVALFFSQFGGF